MDFSFNIKKTIEEIGNAGNVSKRLTFTEWNGHPARLDLRQWITTESGELQPGKGITLSDTEARKLQAALAKYFE